MSTRDRALQRWYRPLLRFVAVLVFAAQTAGIVHAADLDAHAKGDVCQICQHQDRSAALPPVPESIPAPPIVSVSLTPLFAVVPPHAAHDLRPPARAPPC
jgi:hypothetical protein